MLGPQSPLRLLSGLLALALVALAAGPAASETVTFHLSDDGTCSASAAPPRHGPLACTVWRRQDLGRFGAATLTALQMVASDPDGAALGEVVVTETEGATRRIVTRQRPGHQPDFADLAWPEGEALPVPHLEGPWTAAAAQVGEAVVLWVGGVENPAVVKLGGRWRETRIREVVAAARAEAKGRLLGQLVGFEPRTMEARFAAFEPLDPRRPGPAIRGELAIYRLVVHASGVLELGKRRPAQPLPAPPEGQEPGRTAPMRFEADGTATCATSAFGDDDDPAGLHLRAAPAATATSLMRVPKLGGYGLDFEITGARDGWFRVTSGSYPLGPEELGSRARKTFSGTGWVHGSKLATGLSYRELHVLPHPLSGIVARVDNMPGGPSALDNFGAGQAQALRGCLGRWIEMDVRMPSGAVHRGWMPRTCANQLTTCG
ncbi:hypothetical protein [Methylobacterium durans]|uniref:SH3b domain-containing protein n=1 Tax=Methylobacterium durans TaxID=2202825 RepID=A0A2U8WEX0_9HYPH|nr:hypothetical protein [Methylobacterium durans]AWN44101.1 hypothetical protein DK389_30850 [Methylobacterium durans]